MEVAPHSIVTLLLEDDEDDYWLTMEAIGSNGATLVYRVKDGVEGLAYLDGGDGFANGPGGDEIPYKECPLPDLMIVDLVMPRMDGREFIAHVKASERRDWRSIPAVVLTNSRDERDVLDSYDIGAAAYIVKPVNVEEMAVVIRQIRDFYLTVRLPRRGD